MTEFYIQRKRVGRELNSRETKRERGRETECCCKRVAAWTLNLTVGENIYDGQRMIILDLIKMNIYIIYKNLDGYSFLLLLCFSIQPSNCQCSPHRSKIVIGPAQEDTAFTFCLLHEEWSIRTLVRHCILSSTVCIQVQCAPSFYNFTRILCS